MSGTQHTQAADAHLPEHWRDIREWSIEKRQSYRMWVLDVESVIASMTRQLNASLEKYPRSGQENIPELSAVSPVVPRKSLPWEPAPPYKSF